jgi:hypothetical protein
MKLPRRAVVTAVVLSIAVGAFTFAFFITRRLSAPAPITQPILFNHALHVTGKPQLACRDCHPGAERETHAGLPPLERCLLCHMKPQSTSPKEKVVRELAVQGGDFHWTPVSQNAGHVHFSHRAHVSLARMPCASCHRDVAHWTAPPATAEPTLKSMDACVTCHRERGASTDCRVCHH